MGFPGAHLYDTTIGVASVTSRSNYNDPTYGTIATVAARVQQSRRLVTREDGTQAASTHTIYTERAIEPSDRIWLAGVSQTAANSLRPITIDYSNFPDGRTGEYKVAV